MILLFNRNGLPNANEISGFNITQENDVWVTFNQGKANCFKNINGAELFNDLVKALKKNQRTFEFKAEKYGI